MSFSPFSFAKQSAVSSRQIVTDFTNASAITAIPQAMACSVTDTTSQISPTDVSSDTSVKGMVGYANLRLATSTLGPIISNGRLENFTTSFAIGTAVYVGKDANPTNIVPSVGVNGFLSGDTVIFMGIVVKNETNPSNKDIQLMTQVIGVL